MAPHRPRLTPELIRDLCHRIRAGAFEHVASESLGVPVEVYQQWLARGLQPRAGKIYRELYRSVRQARAHARCMAEMAMRSDNPRTWLLHGPGKETEAVPGWSSSPRAASLAAAGEQRAELLAVIAAVYQALRPFPDARQAVLAALQQFPELPPPS